ncbi:MAG: hypothetical protein IPH07_26465 [Deltaproteobacteria bacterium]|nr:hypothetical protein [Deltaproteobacteria bacterium]MBK8240420.1 hypothetical protein [Deltaproteobacteria bacterium]MBK8718304.1 hypothetical protein [Deltaproteobacteria bacterium]MBP7291455.1 hypothetical protein [Nannocystaceae bacterium]
MSGDFLLPAADERDAILESLAGLVRARGYEHLVLSPLVEPDERHFPDRWGGGEASVARVLRRLLVYADLEGVQPRIVVEPDLGLGPMSPAGVGSPAWLAGVVDGVPQVRVRESSLRDPFVLVPAMARVASAIFRKQHRLATGDPEREERQVDLTSVFLGFGLVTVPAAVRRSTSRAGGRVQATTTRIGVLDPRSLAFALAVVLELRGTEGARMRGIDERLGADGAAFVAAARTWFRAQPQALADRLAVPPRAQWPDPPALSLLTAPLPDDPATSMEQRLDEDKGVQGMNAGKPVFRVERSKAMRLARMLGLPVLLLGMLAGRMNVGVEFEMWKAMLIAGGLALTGLLIGRLLPDARCSEPKCGQTLTKDQLTCPLCGGRIAGVIHHPRERLAAEEALARAEGEPPA